MLCLPRRGHHRRRGLLRQQEEAEVARVLEGIRQGLEDMRAGRGRPAEEVFADIRREFNLPPD